MEEVRIEVRGVLRSHGLRATAARIAVLAALHEARIPLTHEQVMDLLPEAAFDKASVWRILADLAEHGVLRRMDLGDRVWRYELLDRCRDVADDHPHLLCEQCGKVDCLPSLEVRTPAGAVPEALVGAEVRVRVLGRCADCVAQVQPS